MTEEVAPTGCTTQGFLGMPVGVTVDLRTASLLSGLYGVSGAIAAVLLLPLIAARTEVQLPVPTPVFAALLAVLLTVIYALLGWAGLRMARRRGVEPAPTLTKLWQGLGVRIGWHGMAAGCSGKSGSAALSRPRAILTIGTCCGVATHGRFLRMVVRPPLILLGGTRGATDPARRAAAPHRARHATVSPHGYLKQPGVSSGGPFEASSRDP